MALETSKFIQGVYGFNGAGLKQGRRSRPPSSTRCHSTSGPSSSTCALATLGRRGRSVHGTKERNLQEAHHSQWPPARKHLAGSISKAPYLTQAFDRNTPLPEERLSLRFDIGAPSVGATIDEMPQDMQVCNCSGVTKGAIGGCVTAGKRTLKTVMETTRAGMGCGACKSLVSDVVAWACGGAAELDPFRDAQI